MKKEVAELIINNIEYLDFLDFKILEKYGDTNM